MSLLLNSGCWRRLGGIRESHSYVSRWMHRDIATQSSSPAKLSSPATPLSNRQKFQQIEPTANLYAKLEVLGFGTLRRTRRFSEIRSKTFKHNEASKYNKAIKYSEAMKHNRAPQHITTSSVSPPKEKTYSFSQLSFIAGAKTAASFPPEDLPEIGFVGRSNVGKSSLLNSLAESTTVRVSDKPGFTQQINFFSSGSRFIMVDMPGYGFAFVDETERQKWRELMESYVESRKILKRLYVVIDARHGIKVADDEFFHMLDSKQVKFQIVLTKGDLQVLPALARRVTLTQAMVQKYKYAVKDVLVVSSLSGAGIQQMRKEILHLTTKKPVQRNINNRENAKNAKNAEDRE